MKVSFSSFVLLQAAISNVIPWRQAAAHDDDDDHHHHDHICGAEPVSSLQAARDQARLQRALHTERRLQKLSCTELCDGCIQIDTYFHFMMFNFDGGLRIPHPTAVMRRYDNGDTSVRGADFTNIEGMRAIIGNQVDVANRLLQGTPFRLNWIQDPILFTQVDNNNFMRYPIDSNREMSATIGHRDISVLDVYLSYTILYESEANDNPPPLRVGNAYLPSQQLEGKSDGLFMRYDTLTGGGLGNGSVDQGITLIHELGHCE